MISGPNNSGGGEGEKKKKKESRGRAGGRISYCIAMCPSY
jgi:hypothetical protein